MSKTDQSSSLTEQIDTLSKYPVLPNSPLLSTYIAYHSNPTITGRIKGWEERKKRMYVDTIFMRTIKTMEMDDIWLASESPIALYNYDGPILLRLKQDKPYHTYDYWTSHNLDEALENLSFSSNLTNTFDCRFGNNDLMQFLKNSNPLEINDTSSFIPLISDKVNGKLYSPLFECLYRNKPFLICSFDIEGLQNTAGGQYLWDIIRNYTYSSCFREILKTKADKVSHTAWFDCLTGDSDTK